MQLVKKVKFIYPEFEVDTADFPELEGKTLDDIRMYMEKHGEAMHPLHKGYESLQEELDAGVRAVVLEEYPDEQAFFVQTEEEVV